MSAKKPCAECGVRFGDPCPVLGFYVCTACADRAEATFDSAMADLKRIAERDQRRRAGRPLTHPMLRRLAHDSRPRTSIRVRIAAPGKPAVEHELLVDEQAGDTFAAELSARREGDPSLGLALDPRTTFELHAIVSEVRVIS